MKTALYEALIEAIPAEIRVEAVVRGASWVVVSADCGVGVAMRQYEAGRPALLEGALEGLRLRDLAAAVRSWNFQDACLGAAAINAFYNTPRRLGDPVGAGSDSPREQDPFVRYRSLAVGRKVAAVGHFSALRELAPLCDLVIIDREQNDGDYPEAAAEYLLAHRELVFISGSTLANKTLPRLLQVCAGAMVVLVGPSVPLAASLFGYGVGALAGSVFPDAARCLRVAAGNGGERMVKQGYKLIMESG